MGRGNERLLEHALCWVHAERLINRLIPLTEAQRLAVSKVQDELWDFYQDLKTYKTLTHQQQQQQKARLEERFDQIFTTTTLFETLNQVLRRLHRRKRELLKVLERPDLPLHNNASEQDIREFVTKRKISGSTRSESGRRCRDTFASLKKTCRKLGVSFWEYLLDRVSGKNLIPKLGELMSQKALGSQCPLADNSALSSAIVFAASEPWLFEKLRLRYRRRMRQNFPEFPDIALYSEDTPCATFNLMNQGKNILKNSVIKIHFKNWSSDCGKLKKSAQSGGRVGCLLHSILLLLFGAA